MREGGHPWGTMMARMERGDSPARRYRGTTAFRSKGKGRAEREQEKNSLLMACCKVFPNLDTRSLLRSLLPLQWSLLHFISTIARADLAALYSQTPWVVPKRWRSTLCAGQGASSAQGSPTPKQSKGVRRKHNDYTDQCRVIFKKPTL